MRRQHEETTVPTVQSGHSGQPQDTPPQTEPHVKRQRTTVTSTESSSGPGPSGESCGDHSMINRNDFKHSSFHPPPHAPAFGSELPTKILKRPSDPLEEHQDPKADIQTELDGALQSQWFEDKLVSKIKNELRNYHKALSFKAPQLSQMTEGQRERKFDESILKLIANVLRETKGEQLADYFQTVFCGPTGEFCSNRLKARLQQKFTCLSEGIPKAGKACHLNEIYTELYITEGDVSDYNNKHDIIQIEAAPRNKAEETITCQEIFTSDAHRHGPIRTVLTKGVAGIGKTVLTQKFSLDWAEGRANQDIQLLFLFTFRELNVLRDRSMSLMQLIHHFFPETREAAITSFEDFKAVLILDGLDEFRIPLDFKTYVIVDADKSASVDVLLVNLIRGSLLPSAHLWITTRPAAANQIPSECVSRVTEVRGFTDPQKEQYFRKRFPGKRQASAIIDHIHLSRSLRIMCSIPVFCWITATVVDDIMKTRHEVLLPKTLTEMYIHFLVVQVKIKNVKYENKAEADPHWSQKSISMIKCLAKLAFEQLQKGNLIFYQSDLTECGIDVEEAAVDSGVFTQISKEDRGLYQDRVYCFIHLSVQEFLAALHVHVTFSETGVSVLPSEKAGSSQMHFYHSAVDLALQSPNGHLDLFLRFLLGLSLPTNQSLLRGFLKQNQDTRDIQNQIIDYIKQKVSESCNTERSINLFHCLNELKDSSLVEQIQQQMTSGSLCAQKLSSNEWSALAFILLSSNKDLEEFDLLRLLPVVKVSTKAIVNVCSLSERGCSSLSSILSTSSSLKELDLSNNVLKVPMVKLLFQGLKTSPCPLEVLCLCNCSLSERSCEVLASLLTSPSLSLVQLDLANNNLMDSGIRLLSEGLRNPQCNLENLGLSGCMMTEKSSSSLVSALDSNPHKLKMLDLSYNHLCETGKQLLTKRVATLRVEPGGARFIKSGLKKYSCQFILDPTTKSIFRVEEEQSYPDQSDRFDCCPQVLCCQRLSGRCYCELEWSGWVDVSVCNEGIRRRGASNDCVFGLNAKSWCLICSDGPYSISHNKSGNPLPLSSVSSAGKVAVYVDCPGGSVTFYTVSGEELTLLHKFNATFNEPLFLGIGLWSSKSSATLCD
ncbi:NLR family CARD domain-containing protein 3-like [Boleophthalmus pectinirostris]|uniref:NLR family CARD domain-containing protein 3-like n=1 Tax=Boleophthalmus pectinirostris TaxID=150288 RepID=UPI00242B8B14|nr:NLR family CARD domain-containing protein 3-like [Boleophthalmus pectinirostris]